MYWLQLEPDVAGAGVVPEPASSIIDGVLDATDPSEPVLSGESLGEGAMPGHEPELETADVPLWEGACEPLRLPAFEPS